MPDIAKCQAPDCPIRNTCYRFTSVASVYNQSYFTEQPGKFVGRKFECEQYWKVEKK